MYVPFGEYSGDSFLIICVSLASLAWKNAAHFYTFRLVEVMVTTGIVGTLPESSLGWGLWVIKEVLGDRGILHRNFSPREGEMVVTVAEFDARGQRFRSSSALPNPCKPKLHVHNF